MDRILGKSWWPDVCHLSQGAHTPYTRGIPWVKSPERVRLTGGRACWRERGHSYRSISSYRKLPPPACPGTTCNRLLFTDSELFPFLFLVCASNSDGLHPNIIATASTPIVVASILLAMASNLWLNGTFAERLASVIIGVRFFGGLPHRQ